MIKHYYNLKQIRDPPNKFPGPTFQSSGQSGQFPEENIWILKMIIDNSSIIIQESNIRNLFNAQVQRLPFYYFGCFTNYYPHILPYGTD